MSAVKHSDTPTRELLDAYAHGWHVANLASGATDPTLPSVVELVRIKTEYEAQVA